MSVWHVGDTRTAAVQPDRPGGRAAPRDRRRRARAHRRRAARAGHRHGGRRRRRPRAGRGLLLGPAGRAEDGRRRGRSRRSTSSAGGCSGRSAARSDEADAADPRSAPTPCSRAALRIEEILRDIGRTTAVDDRRTGRRRPQRPSDDSPTGEPASTRRRRPRRARASSTRRPAGRPTTSWPSSRQVLGTRKVGHAGTLDPDATGVLLLGVGRATRLLRFLTGAAQDLRRPSIVLGTETDTLDAAGEVTATHDMAGVDARRGAGRGGGADRRRSCRCRRWCRR